jgi:hypothetical protein
MVTTPIADTVKPYIGRHTFSAKIAARPTCADSTFMQAVPLSVTTVRNIPVRRGDGAIDGNEGVLLDESF